MEEMALPIKYRTAGNTRIDFIILLGIRGLFINISICYYLLKMNK